MNLYNTLTKKIEEFKPINPPEVGLYTCGMTVYDYAHIGHGRKYVMDDVLKRTLDYFSYKVKHVQNVTDVGHLVSDADEGEDKLEKGARKSGKTVWEVAEYFTDHFYSTMDKLGIVRPDIIAKATDHIDDQITMIGTLLGKGYAYDTPEAVYFDISKFPDYGKLFGQSLDEKEVAVRSEVQKGNHKRNPADFALWFKRIGRFADHAMHWDSPWGDGFPGWHIECSAMSIKYLGEQFDIHTGGEDHLPVHHPNEIAQSEAATGKSPFVKYWVHYSFLMVDGRKMSKSLDNFFTIEDVVDKGFDPLSLRYLYLTTHYKSPLNFTWAGLESAQNALSKLRDQVSALNPSEEGSVGEQAESLRKQFRDNIRNDLNTPQALATTWEVVRSDIPDSDKLALIFEFDDVLGLGLEKSRVAIPDIPESIKTMAEERDKLRKSGEFDKADDLREEIEKQGFLIKDQKDGHKLKKK